MVGRQSVPARGVPGTQLAALDEAVVGSAIAEQNERRFRLGALREASIERVLEVGSAAQMAGAHELHSFCDGCLVCWDRRGSKGFCLCVEENEIETILGAKRIQKLGHGGVAAFQLVPLHGKRGIEEDHD